MYLPNTTWEKSTTANGIGPVTLITSSKLQSEFSSSYVSLLHLAFFFTFIAIRFKRKILKKVINFI